MSKLFEQRLCDEWAMHRTDILEGNEIVPLGVLRAAQPVRPYKALEILEVSEDELVSMLANGMLRRPGRWGGGRVAWRCDDIMAARQLLEDIRER